MHYAGHAAYIWVSNPKTAKNKEKDQGKGPFFNYVGTGGRQFSNSRI